MSSRIDAMACSIYLARARLSRSSFSSVAEGRSPEATELKELLALKKEQENQSKREADSSRRLPERTPPDLKRVPGSSRLLREAKKSGGKPNAGLNGIFYNSFSRSLHSAQ